ncbi:MAG: hypothetical protein OXH57_01290 [Ekhidna sp.]|nr:hypothetical protein [Ekhidna sp.]
MKNTILLLLASFLLPGCNDDEHADQNDQILGTWKFIKIHIITEMGEFEKDYSEFGITFTFSSDGILTVDRGNSPSEDDWLGRVDDWLDNYHQAKYEFGYFHLGSSYDPKTLLVKINDGKRTYSYDGSTMILGLSYVDGPDYHFIKQ